MAAKYRSLLPLVTFGLLILLAGGLMTLGLQHGNSSVIAAQDSGQSKIADWVIANTANGRSAEFLVILADQAELSASQTFSTKQEKGRFVRNTLLAKAQATQGPILDWLNEAKIEHQAFYIVNAIKVTGTREVVDALAARADVARIEGNPRVKNHFTAQPTAEEIRAAVKKVNAPEAIELGVNNIRAPEVWALGFTGQGIVIGGADTGIKWDHNALKNKYRGWNGSTADHNYNWHDSIHSGGGVCGANTTAPCDDDDHGTHTVGTVLGDDGGSNQIGVAPGAKFIGCRNMDQGNGQPSTYIECMEWFLAPYPVGGTPAQGDPAKAPDITTNSWGCPPSEGCSPGSLQSAVEAQRAAGIMMVVAAGNSGSGCSTVSDPPSFYAASYTVGAYSASTNLIASFSSRGPATADGSNRLKPEITAPGVSVRSALRGSASSYGSLSGTSMATPHTAGAVALLWSARPNLRHQIQQTIDVLNQAAVDVSSTLCSSSGVPNNVYGWGRLDIKATVDAAGTTCTYSIAPTSATAPAIGGLSTVNVMTTTGCAWMATSNAAWLNITAGTPGNGNGSITYSIATNTGAARSGTLTIAGQIFTVNQDAAGGPVVRAKKSDFDGDGKTDFSAWRGADSFWRILRSSDSNQQNTSWGASYSPYFDTPVPGDYDGDGKTDIAVWRSSTGVWFIINSSNSAVQAVTHGQPGDTPVAGDYDGDGKTDLAVWRGASSQWIIKRSSDSVTQTTSWGSSLAPYYDLPVPGDYDGDGKTDIGIFRRLDGNWYILKSSNNSALIQSWGLSTDTPVPGDYDGDGKYDIAVWRSSDGNWYILKSSNGQFQVQNWGTAAAPYNDVPVPGDYDGDGKFDLAVWRPLDGNWYVIRSSNASFLIQNLGQSGDTPVPSKQW